MIVLEEIRCPDCGRKLGNLSGIAQIKCPKCKAMVEVDTETRKVYIRPERRK